MDYKDKKEKYFKTNVELFPNSLRLMQSTTWNISDLQKHHGEILLKLVQ